MSVGRVCQFFLHWHNRSHKSPHFVDTHQGIPLNKSAASVEIPHWACEGCTPGFNLQ